MRPLKLYLKSNLNKEKVSWIFYDFGNSAYATTVIAAFFPLFYEAYWSAGLEELQSTQYLAFALTIINLIILISAPIIGAITDYKKLTKALFIIFTLLSITSVASFYFIPMGKWLIALILYGISFFSFASAVTLYDKMLIYVAPKEQLTKVSSYGFSLGYLGGGLLFALNAFMVLQPQTFGLANEAEATRWAFITVSVWWFIFLLPLAINYKDREVEKTGSFKEVFAGFLSTFKNIKENRNVLLFLLAFFLYIDGVHTIMSLAAIFAENIGIDTSAIIIALILVQFVAFPSTLFWAYIGSKYNDKIVLYSTIFIYICVVIYSTMLSNATEFYIMAVLIGSIQGGIQAASRSFFSKIIPKSKSGEFFGLYNTFGRAGSVLGPFLVGLFIVIFGNLQISLVPIIILFIVGGIVLKFVKYPNEII